MPADHEWFANTNAAQWRWYLQHIIKDQEEEYKTQRNLLEYHVSFLEPELVNKIRKQRNEDDENKRSDKEFAKTIKSMFGRDVGFDGNRPKPNEEGFQEVSDILDKVQQWEVSQQQIKSQSVYNFSEWVDFKLE